MGDRTPTSVILPTTGWNAACEEIADQLRPADELLVVCDSALESVADRVDDYPDNVRMVVAGDPEGCSGKANAIAAGMEAAERDRIVWTDDDFHHSPDWLEGLCADYERHGPTSEVPVFVGRDPLATLLEPTQAISGTFAVYLPDIAWAGSVVFERDDPGDEAAFLRGLRRTISDDCHRLDDSRATRRRTRTRAVRTGRRVRRAGR